MIKGIFIRATIVTGLETRPLGSHLDTSATALQDQRYTASAISIHIREAQECALNKFGPPELKSRASRQKTKCWPFWPRSDYAHNKEMKSALQARSPPPLHITLNFT
jgi:hypothetical protein